MSDSQSGTDLLRHPLEHFTAPLSPAEVNTASSDSPFIPHPTDHAQLQPPGVTIPRQTPSSTNGTNIHTGLDAARPPETQVAGPSTSRTGAAGGPAGFQDWEEEYQRKKLASVEEKVKKDLEGWRGGHGTIRSTYPRGALPKNSYYHQPVTGTIGKHLPKEVVRVERDWSGGEVCQFETTYPMELEGRIDPKQFTGFIHDLNEIMTSAYSVRGAILDNLVAIGTLWTSVVWRTSHFERELQRAEQLIRTANVELFNPQGLDVQSPRSVALQFLEIEYY